MEEDTDFSPVITTEDIPDGWIIDKAYATRWNIDDTDADSPTRVMIQIWEDDDYAVQVMVESGDFGGSAQAMENVPELSKQAPPEEATQYAINLVQALDSKQPMEKIIDSFN